MTDAGATAETGLRIALRRADLELKTQQAFWETPKSIAVLVGTTAAITAAVAGLLGFKLGQGQQFPPPQTIIIQQPAPPAPPAVTGQPQGH